MFTFRKGVRTSRRPPASIHLPFSLRTYLGLQPSRQCRVGVARGVLWSQSPSSMAGSRSNNKEVVLATVGWVLRGRLRWVFRGCFAHLSGLTRRRRVSPAAGGWTFGSERNNSLRSRYRRRGPPGSLLLYRPGRVSRAFSLSLRHSRSLRRSRHPAIRGFSRSC